MPHRVEFVASDEGVSYYDDSKATTPSAVVAALAGFSSVVLIAGGRNKGLDLGAIEVEVRGSRERRNRRRGRDRRGGRRGRCCLSRLHGHDRTLDGASGRGGRGIGELGRRGAVVARVCLL